jgi:mannose-1-phosphate guanylyltransferase
MEKLDDLATLPLDCGWSDLGSWLTLDEVLDKDADGNALVGDVVTLDSRDNLLLADQGCVAAVGVEDLVVVRTADVVLVAPKHRSQEVRDLVDRLRTAGRDELL